MVPSYKVVVLLCSILSSGAKWVEASFYSVAETPSAGEVNLAAGECKLVRDALSANAQGMACQCFDVREQPKQSSTKTPGKTEI